ncbi:MAG: DUF4878 domain-containing protein [Bacteroidaceae bacterium]|nr:DUF4878 domain-containing protein [Bacteroidaceae bacterium]
MKKLISAALVCIAACLMAACSSGQSPKATVEKYATAVMKGDYRTALEQVAFKGTPEEVARTREQYASLCEEKTKEGMKDSDRLSAFTIDNEQVDDEGGTAIVTTTMTYADGHQKTDDVKLVKDDDGQWLIDSNK